MPTCSLASLDAGKRVRVCLRGVGQAGRIPARRVPYGSRNLRTFTAFTF